MRLIRDDGKGMVLHLLTAQLLDHFSKGLDSDDDDWLPLSQCGSDPGALRTALSRDALDDSLFVIKLVDRLLELRIENRTISHDDYRVEEFLVVRDPER